MGSGAVRDIRAHLVRFVLSVLAVALGVAFMAGTLSMPTVFATSGMTTPAIPWAALAGMLAIAAVVGVLAALRPAVRAARLPVLDAVASC